MERVFMLTTKTRESAIRAYVRAHMPKNIHARSVMSLAFEQALAVSSLKVMACQKERFSPLDNAVLDRSQHGVGIFTPGWKVKRGGERGNRRRQRALPKV